MTGILLSIVVVSTSAIISAQKIVKKVRHRQPIHPDKHPPAKQEAPKLDLLEETPGPQPYVPAKETSITHILAIYQQIALQKGYYAGVVDILNHSEGKNYILWLEKHDISFWQDSLDLQPVPDLIDPAGSLTLYDQDLYTALSDLSETDFTRITLCTTHYTITDLAIKSTNPNTKKSQSNITKQIQTKDLTHIHHKPGVERLEINQLNQRPRIIPQPQVHNNFDLSEQETKDAT